MKHLNTKEKVISILINNKNTYLTCRNIQHIIRSKWGKMPPDGTVSSVLYKLTHNNLLERQENIGCKKGYGYKITSTLKIQKISKITPRSIINAVTEISIE
jgi:hypothetical protein